MQDYEIIRTAERYDEYLRTLTQEEIVFDTETTGLKYHSQLLGISLYDARRHPIYVPTNTYFKDGVPLADIVRISNKYFPKLKGIAHNGKYDLGVFKAHGISDIELVKDSMILVHTFNPEMNQKLENRIAADFSFEKKQFKEIIGKNWDKIDWIKDVASGLITTDILGKYACEDVYWTWMLADKYYKLCEAEGLLKIHDSVEIPIAYVLRDMFADGVSIKTPVLDEIREQLTPYMNKVADEIYEEAGCVFNLNSPKQLGNVLFNKLKLPAHKVTKTGAASTDKEVLSGLAMRGHRIAELLLAYSQGDTLLTNFVNAIPRFLDNDGMLRCSFNSTGTRTTRFSSNNPNLQNQPNNKQFPVRKAFVARPGYSLFALDYSQIELRIMAHAAQDKRMMEAFHNGEDIHGAVAKALGIERKHAKIVNFGVIYGMGAQKLSKSLGISEMEAGKIISGYGRTYNGYYAWKERTEQLAIKQGYILNLFGAVRRLPDVKSNNKAAYFGALRKATNTVIQGSSATLIKKAMITLHRGFKQEFAGNARILLQVHDELLCEARTDLVCDAYDYTQEVMENIVKLSVPLVADGKIIDSWEKMKDDDYFSLYDQIKTGKYVPATPEYNTNHDNDIPLWLLTL